MNEELQGGRTANVKMESAGRYTGSGPKGGRFAWVILAVVVVVLVVLGIIFRDSLFGKKSAEDTPTGTVGEYQAVFLTNGQVYFGKLTGVNKAYAELTDIYYLQVTTPPLQGSADQTATQKSQPQLQLVKLGNELHGPMDQMQINREHILFYEDLKGEGRVIQAIKEYQANPNRGAQGTQQPATQQPTTVPATNTQQPVTAPAGN